MLASQVINLAKSTELKQLAIASDVDAVLGFLNLGVLDLPKRFPLMTAYALLTIQDAKVSYALDGTDLDVGIPTIENFLVVTDCYTPSIVSADYPPCEIVINDENNKFGIMTPTYNSIKINDGLMDPDEGYGQDTELTITYRRGIAFITQTSDTFELPSALLEALLHYIGYRGHATVSGDVKQENNTHYVRFTASCDKAEELGLVVPDDLENYKFDNTVFP